MSEGGQAIALPQEAPGHWDTPEGREMAVECLGAERASLAHGLLSDFLLANRIFLVGRFDLDLIDYQTAAKERIRWLSARVAAIAAIVRADDGELLDKLAAIGALVGVPPPPEYQSPIVMGEDAIVEGVEP